MVETAVTPRGVYNTRPAWRISCVKIMMKVTWIVITCDKSCLMPRGLGGLGLRFERFERFERCGMRDKG